MKKRVWIVLAAVLLFIVVALGGGVLYLKTAARGFSAREQPSKVEAVVATFARRLAIPASAKNMKNPLTVTPAVIHQGLAHYADHCAVCHANNGSGQTMYGKGLYPKPPDMRGETQSMSDGEIFYTIENGVRLTGMPAFGGVDTADETWPLVAFIRHLPNLTAAEEAEMQSLNPKTPGEYQEEQEEEQFLNGGTDSSQPKTSMHHH